MNFEIITQQPSTNLNLHEENSTYVTNDGNSINTHEEQSETESQIKASIENGLAAGNQILHQHYCHIGHRHTIIPSYANIKNEILCSNKESEIIDVPKPIKYLDFSQKLPCPSPDCHVRCTNNKSLLKHINCFNHQTVTVYICIRCEAPAFDSMDSLTEHLLQNHRSADLHTCSICNKYFFYTSSYEEHLDLHVRKTTANHKCSICNKSFRTKANLKTHEHSHKTHEKILHCKSCNSQFNYASNLTKHVKKYHRTTLVRIINKPDKLHKHSCSFCSAIFMKLSSLIQHELTNHNKKPSENPDFNINVTYSCVSQCGRAYSKKSNLNKHTKNCAQYMLAFYGHTFLSCSYCKATFCHQEHLDLHTKLARTEHSDTDAVFYKINEHTRYLCLKCGKTYPSKLILTTHKPKCTNTCQQK